MSKINGRVTIPTDVDVIPETDAGARTRSATATARIFPLN